MFWLRNKKIVFLLRIKAGFIQASISKIQGLLKASPTVFKDLKLTKNTDLSVKILLQKG